MMFENRSQKFMTKKHQVLYIGALVTALFITFLVLMGKAVQAQEDSIWYMPVTLGTPQSAEEYDVDFTDSIEPWAARRWSAGPDFEIDHEDGCEDGHCGFLDMKVHNSAAYVIASPLQAVKADFTYRITTRARMMDREDGHAYGIIFGADRTANECPGDEFKTCFTEYYEFRVQYRNEDGDRYLEWKLKKVEGHDENNQNIGPDIIDWKRLEGVDPASWVKWDIEVHNDGQMHISANNVEQAGSARDDDYIRNEYFGLIGRTGSNGGAHILFDTYKIEGDV